MSFSMATHIMAPRKMGLRRTRSGTPIHATKAAKASDERTSSPFSTFNEGVSLGFLKRVADECNIPQSFPGARDFTSCMTSFLESHMYDEADLSCGHCRSRTGFGRHDAMFESLGSLFQSGMKTVSVPLIQFLKKAKFPCLYSQSKATIIGPAEYFIIFSPNQNLAEVLERVCATIHRKNPRISSAELDRIVVYFSSLSAQVLIFPPGREAQDSNGGKLSVGFQTLSPNEQIDQKNDTDSCCDNDDYSFILNNPEQFEFYESLREVLKKCQFCIVVCTERPDCVQHAANESEGGDGTSEDGVLELPEVFNELYTYWILSCMIPRDGDSSQDVQVPVRRAASDGDMLVPNEQRLSVTPMEGPRLLISSPDFNGDKSIAAVKFLCSRFCTFLEEEELTGLETDSEYQLETLIQCIYKYNNHLKNTKRIINSLLLEWMCSEFVEELRRSLEIVCGTNTDSLENAIGNTQSLVSDMIGFSSFLWTKQPKLYLKKREYSVVKATNLLLDCIDEFDQIEEDASLPILIQRNFVRFAFAKLLVSKNEYTEALRYLNDCTVSGEKLLAVFDDGSSEWKSCGMLLGKTCLLKAQIIIKVEKKKDDSRSLSARMSTALSPLQRGVQVYQLQKGRATSTDDWSDHVPGLVKALLLLSRIKEDESDMTTAVEYRTEACAYLLDWAHLFHTVVIAREVSYLASLCHSLSCFHDAAIWYKIALNIYGCQMVPVREIDESNDPELAPKGRTMNTIDIERDYLIADSPEIATKLCVNVERLLSPESSSVAEVFVGLGCALRCLFDEVYQAEVGSPRESETSVEYSVNTDLSVENSKDSVRCLSSLDEAKGAESDNDNINLSDSDESGESGQASNAEAISFSSLDADVQKQFAEMLEDIIQARRAALLMHMNFYGKFDSRVLNDIQFLAEVEVVRGNHQHSELLLSRCRRIEIDPVLNMFRDVGGVLDSLREYRLNLLDERLNSLIPHLTREENCATAANTLHEMCEITLNLGTLGLHRKPNAIKFLKEAVTLRCQVKSRDAMRLRLSELLKLTQLMGELKMSNAAKPYHEDIIGLMKELYGDANHRHNYGEHCVDAMKAFDSFGIVRLRLREFAKARALFEESVEIGENYLQSVSAAEAKKACIKKQIVKVKKNLATLFTVSGETESSLELYSEIYSECTKLYSLEHEETTTCLVELAHAQTRFADELSQALTLAETGEDSVSYDPNGVTVKSVGKSTRNEIEMQRLRDEKKALLDEAENNMFKAIDVLRTMHGEIHTSVATQLNNLAQLLVKKGEIKQAELVMSHAFEIDRSIYGPIHPVVAKDKNFLRTLRNLPSCRSNAQSTFESGVFPLSARSLNSVDDYEDVIHNESDTYSEQSDEEEETPKVLPPVVKRPGILELQEKKNYDDYVPVIKECVDPDESASTLGGYNRCNCVCF